MKRCDQVAGFILAGGASSRMRRDKALLEIGGLPMLVRTANLLEPLVVSVTVIGPPERYRHLGLCVVPDDQPGLGPLGGLATALRISRSEWNLVVGCDLPDLTTDWLDWLIAHAMESRSDAVLPESARGLEPLCGVYRRRCSSAIAAAIARGERKVTDVVQVLALERVLEAEWGRFDPSGALFRNMNTPEDYVEARARLERNLPK